MELHESELVWYKDEGEGVDSSIPLEDIATIDTCESNVDKPNCLIITLVVQWVSVLFCRTARRCTCSRLRRCWR